MFALVAFGFMVYEDVQRIVNENIDILDTKLVWKFVFIFGCTLICWGIELKEKEIFILGQGINGVYEKALFMGKIVIWSSFFQLIGYVIVFWIDYIPTLGYSDYRDNISGVVDALTASMHCFVRANPDCSNTWLFGLLYQIGLVLSLTSFSDLLVNL
jgi:hypothetical protein